MSSGALCIDGKLYNYYIYFFIKNIIYCTTGKQMYSAQRVAILPKKREGQYRRVV
jgi:hypothetical protein